MIVMPEIVGALFAHIEAHGTAYTIAIAVLLGTAGFLNNQQRRREDLTISLLMERFRNDHVRSARRIVYSMSDEDRPILRENFEHSREYHDVLNLLSFYEFVIISMKRGRIDRKTTERLSFRSIIDIYGHCEALVEERRLLTRTPQLFGELEAFARRHRPRR